MFMKNPQLILYSLVKNRKLSLKNNVLVFTLLFYIILEVLARAISQKKKAIWIGKQEKLFTHDTTLYRENPIEHTYTRTHTLLELINKLSKVAGHKTNTQKSVFLCISKEQFVKEIKKTISLTITPRWIKCLGGNKFNQGSESLIKL